MSRAIQHPAPPIVLAGYRLKADDWQKWMNWPLGPRRTLFGLTANTQNWLWRYHPRVAMKFRLYVVPLDDKPNSPVDLLFVPLGEEPRVRGVEETAQHRALPRVLNETFFDGVALEWSRVVGAGLEPVEC
ncbi:hypothetical protein DACRYDRAFT_109062 [Dacryopinax primogenitus]|uniref:Uncharacterized protein n=1 Tax=Dacryopinax primogenitus (strain DJM 731) TaxID=1858805 RepID=M5FVJ5_DACPD|nr:uncharacterized protein DACRYDRAFT_109062 [Dacryopinax primogenitus]EJU00324.1 hypothetical protein DACRYDRAFT_109062 [Dacryopinax primogenitus]